MPLPAWEVVGGLVLLTIGLLPLGLFLLRVAERLLPGARLDRPVERLLVAFYASGALLFVLASVPVSWFGLPLVAGAMGLGFVAMAGTWYRERGRSLREFLSWAWSPASIMVGLGTLGLLVVEVVGLTTLPAANAYDGATHSLFITVMLRNGTAPWTLAPYVSLGVTYPQGSPVWETLPVLLLRWPVLDAPLYLPSLFFTLSLPTAYCLGCRLNDGKGPATVRTGLLFAGFFGMVAAWPRLYIGGSFDFVFALPLFLLVLGWLPRFVSNPNRTWGEVAALGVVVGIAGSLSDTVAIELLLMIGVFGVVWSPGLVQRISRAAARFALIVAITLAFASRSVLGFVVWFSYPGHILAPNGSPPYAPLYAAPPLNYRYVTGMIDPFGFEKGKLSPLPLVSVMVLALLFAGLVVAIVWFFGRTSTIHRTVPRGLAVTAAAASLVTFASASLVLAIGAIQGPFEPIGAVTNEEEFSILFFLSLELLELLPLALCAGLLEEAFERKPGPVAEPPDPDPQAARRAAPPRSRRVVVVVAVVVLVAVFGVGATTTAVSVPPYIHDHIQNLANVTAGDFAALEWAGEHLPACTNVLVAPGSAAQYLPEYATVSVLFPAYPGSYNVSYGNVVRAFTEGTYNGTVRTELVEIQVNVVFVTGPTTSQFPPFNVTAFENSDFVPLFVDGDAHVYEFAPGATVTGCAV